jgi:hypothetical protein
MSDNLIIGLGGILLSVLTYFAGVYRTERRYKKQDKGKRIEHVLARYMEFRKNNKTAGLDGLQKAGVATLKDDSEIRELASIIIKHGENDPLQRSALKMDGIDLKLFFEKASEEKINYYSSDLRSFIEKIRSS